MHQVRIVDGPALRWVLERAQKHFGNHRNTAKALGIAQSVFTRLRNGTVRKSMNFDNYRRIRDALGRHRIEFDLQGMFETSVLTVDGSLVQQHYEQWLRAEYDRLEPKVGSVFTELYGHQEYRGLFADFLKRVTKGTKPSRRRPRRYSEGEHYDLGPIGPVQQSRGIRIHRVGGLEDNQATVTLPGRQAPQDQRVWIALYRAVEPLGDTQLTWGVERTWQEMHHTDDLRSFLQAALKRERIMLNRDRDLVRLNRCRPPEEYLEWLAGPEEEGARYMSPEELFGGLDGAEDAEGEKPQ